MFLSGTAGAPSKETDATSPQQAKYLLCGYQWAFRRRFDARGYAKCRLLQLGWRYTYFKSMRVRYQPTICVESLGAVHSSTPLVLPERNRAVT